MTYPHFPFFIILNAILFGNISLVHIFKKINENGLFSTSCYLEMPKLTLQGIDSRMLKTSGHLTIFLFEVNLLKMPKVAKNAATKINAIISQFPGEFVRTPNKELFCNICSQVVNYGKLYFVDSHRRSARHQRGISQSGGNSTQQFFSPPSSSDFSKDVLKAFLAADIPLHKLRNRELRSLFSSIGHPLPAEQTCRHKINELYEEEMQRIKTFVKDEPAFLVVDESDVSETKYVNILVGTISKPQTAFLVECAPLHAAANSETILRIIDDTISLLSVARSNFNRLLTTLRRT